MVWRGPSSRLDPAVGPIRPTGESFESDSAARTPRSRTHPIRPTGAPVGRCWSLSRLAQLWSSSADEPQQTARRTARIQHPSSPCLPQWAPLRVAPRPGPTLFVGKNPCSVEDPSSLELRLPGLPGPALAGAGPDFFLETMCFLSEIVVAYSMQLTQPSTSVPSSASWRRRM